MDSPKTFAEIDLRALSQNLGVVKSKTKNKTVLAVVKAGAYGHGSVRVSRHLLKNGASMLGVAFTEEAIELREAGIKAPIVVFFDPNDPEIYFKYSLKPVIFDLKNAKTFSARAGKLNKKISVHLKVDTGMGRVGMSSSNAISEILKIAELKNLRLEGLMSHFSDAGLADQGFAEHQLEEFTCLIRALKEKGINFKFHHIANSAAVLRFPKAHFNMVRPGIMLYGYGPGARTGLKPVLSLKSRIIFIKTVPEGTPISYGRTFITKRKSTIATVPLGYADG
ncbi:MAG TPA: alanine racemase, partial [Nitrospirae bacterium]|nr:alanine racemase [Nitrospirota bacterium]